MQKPNENFFRAKAPIVLAGFTLGVAAIFVAMYLATAIPRVLYPYDLDFIEDGLLMTSLRLVNQQPVFLPPNAEFVPHVYMPLPMVLGSLLFKLTGPSFWPLRLISLAATLTTTILIYWITRRESGLSWLGLICAGLFLGGYRISGFWYELVRVDSLFVTLTLAGVTVGIYGADSHRGLLGAALLLTLAFFTKQTALLMGLALTLYLFLKIGRRAWLFALIFGLLTVIPVTALNWWSQGWFLYYTFHIAGINPLEVERMLYFSGGELLGTMVGLTLLALVAGFLALRTSGRRMIYHKPWYFFIGLAILISGMGRASVGGNLNNLMPAYTWLCLAPALCWREWPHRPDWRATLVPLLILIQFGLGIYNPLRYLPTPAMRDSGDRLVAKIASIQGEVLVSMHPYYAWLAGKEPSAQLASLWHARERGQLPLPQDMVGRLQGHYYAAIISDQSLFETEPAWRQLLETYYRPAETLTVTDAPPTNTGLIVRPAIIYVPK